MIVNPQLFNYRLIIGSLLVVLTVLGVYSFTNYKSIKSYEEFLDQEKSLIEKELSDILNSYNELSQDYDLMFSELQEAKLEAKNALSSLRLLQGDLSIITKFKDQLLGLKTKSKFLIKSIDSLNSVNIKLKEQKRYALNTIKTKSEEIAQLEAKNADLSKTITNAATIKANRIEVIAYKLKVNKKKITEKANRANAFDVCIALNENALTLKGNKTIFIQVVSPQGNIIADKGEAVFGNNSLIYSQKEVFNFDNKNLKLCTDIIADEDDKPFVKGSYFINVFHEDRKLGSTRIDLK